MAKLLIDPTLPDGPKFVDAPELAFSLHMKALCYTARSLTDGFVPAGVARRLVKASSREFQRAITHLSAVQFGCSSASWEERPGGWYLHDYDDPQYANPMRADSEQAARTRQLAGKTGGLKSAAARRAKYGSAQPKRTTSAQAASSPPEANPEAVARSQFGDVASSEGDEAPKQTPNDRPPKQSKLPALRTTTTDTLRDKDNVSKESGDNATSVANGSGPGGAWAACSTLALRGHITTWFLAWRGWTNVRPTTHAQLEKDAKAMADLDIPGDQLYDGLQELASKSDRDDVNGLSYFWQPLQDWHHASTKQQRSHASSELTKLAPSIPPRRAVS